MLIPAFLFFGVKMKFYSYALGAFALTYLGLTLHYQEVANNALATIEQLKRPASATETLAIKNRNPLNVKALSGNNKWQGQIGVDEQGHAIFSTWEHGMRAGAIVLKNYKKRHGIETVEGIVRRFAEGNQEEYIAFMCKRLEVKPDEKIDIIRRMPEILRAMARFESGETLPERLFVAYDILGRI